MASVRNMTQHIKFIGGPLDGEVREMSWDDVKQRILVEQPLPKNASTFLRVAMQGRMPIHAYQFDVRKQSYIHIEDYGS